MSAAFRSFPQANRPTPEQMAVGLASESMNTIKALLKGRHRQAVLPVVVGEFRALFVEVGEEPGELDGAHGKKEATD